MIYLSIFYQLHLWLRIFHNMSVQFHPQPPIQKHACKLQTSVYTLIFSLFQNTHHWISWSSRVIKNLGLADWFQSICIQLNKSPTLPWLALTNHKQLFLSTVTLTHVGLDIYIKQDIVHIILFNNILIQQFFTWNSVIPAIDTIKNS